MAVYINTLIGGNITIGSGGGGSTPAERTATRVWYGNDENVYTDYEISGVISAQNTEDPPPIPTSQISNVKTAKKIEFGSTVTEIGPMAFIECTNLVSITFSNNVLIIGSDAFTDCTGLTSITIPDSVSSIENSAFYNCNNITSVTIVANGSGGSAPEIKEELIAAGVPEDITWNMPS